MPVNVSASENPVESHSQFQDEAWTIILCHGFFDNKALKHLEERMKTRRGPDWIGSLDTYERTLVHEYMHVDWISTREHSQSHSQIGSWISTNEDIVTDLKGRLEDGGPVVEVYGENRCNEFARKDLPRGQPNREVAINGELIPCHDFLDAV